MQPDTGVGAILSQQCEGKQCPCALCRLSSAEKNDGIGDAELLTVKLVFEEWRQRLEILE